MSISAALLRPAAAVALVVGLALPAAGQVNVNELAGGFDLPESTVAAIPEGGVENADAWYKINNAAVNAYSRLVLRGGQAVQAAEMVVYVDDIRWSSGNTNVQSPQGTGQRAGQGYLFPDVPRYAIVVWQPDTKIAYSINSTDRNRPNLMTFRTGYPIQVLVNDGGKRDAYANNSGAFDFWFKVRAR